MWGTYISGHCCWTTCYALWQVGVSDESHHQRAPNSVTARGRRREGGSSGRAGVSSQSQFQGCPYWQHRSKPWVPKPSLTVSCPTGRSRNDTDSWPGRQGACPLGVPPTVSAQLPDSCLERQKRVEHERGGGDLCYRRPAPSGEAWREREDATARMEESLKAGASFGNRPSAGCPGVQVGPSAPDGTIPTPAVSTAGAGLLF